MMNTPTLVVFVQIYTGMPDIAQHSDIHYLHRDLQDKIHKYPQSLLSEKRIWLLRNISYNGC